MKKGLNFITRNLAFASVLLVAGAFTGCDTARTSEESQIIEGCEYIVSKNSYGNSLTHKGNCMNPIHKCTCH
jgi:hypothetical protein